MKAYELLSHQAGVIGLIRQRRYFDQLRRAGALTEKLIREELPNGFWLHFGFSDARDYLMRELHYTDEEVSHLLDNEKEKEDQNGQPDRKENVGSDAGEAAGPGNAREEKPLW